ncbi:RNA polymerase sigma-70 factor [Pedobacter heparinus]|uniref:RNA polymerase sigma factor n=1 Tax=Pedobacter heparinus TaxID=984 RepID=UPI00292DE781|nr:RNA polymerase sigma-70 factor [Pedobacter heparinus]
MPRTRDFKALENEAELLARVAIGDQRAFSELFEAYYNLLGTYVLKMTKSMEISEEIVQDIFIKIWLRRADLPEIKSFSNYTFIMCRNRVLDHLRKQAREKLQAVALEKFLIDEAENTDAQHSSEVYRALIDRVVSKLPEQSKRVYMLSRYDRLKHHQIAQQLGISQETVKKHIQYAVSFIKTELKSNIELSILAVMTIFLIFF